MLSQSKWIVNHFISCRRHIGVHFLLDFLHTSRYWQWCVCVWCWCWFITVCAVDCFAVSIHAFTAILARSCCRICCGFYWWYFYYCFCRFSFCLYIAFSVTLSIVLYAILNLYFLSVSVTLSLVSIHLFVAVGFSGFYYWYTLLPIICANFYTKCVIYATFGGPWDIRNSKTGFVASNINVVETNTLTANEIIASSSIGYGSFESDCVHVMNASSKKWI